MSHSPPEPPTLHVGGIGAPGTEHLEDEDKLQEFFSQFGTVLAVTLRYRRKDGKVSWALVAFGSDDSLAKAIEAYDSEAGKSALSMKGADKLVVRKVDAAQAAKSTGAMKELLVANVQKWRTAQQSAKKATKVVSAVSAFRKGGGGAALTPPPGMTKMQELAWLKKQKAAGAPGAAKPTGGGAEPPPGMTKMQELAWRKKQNRSADSAPAATPGFEVHVGGIGAPGTEHLEDEAVLEEMFAQFGAIVAVTLRRRRKAGKVSWALVAFEAADAVGKAIAAFATEEGRAALSAEGLVVKAVSAEQAAKSKGAMKGVQETVRRAPPLLSPVPA